MAGQHEILACSDADRWVQCPLAISISAMFPEVGEKPEAAEGDAFHWVCFETIRGYPEVEIPVGTVAPNGVMVTQAMLEGVDLVLDAIGDKIAIKERLHLEEKVKNGVVHPTANGGTPDLWTFNYSVLDVFDWKFGYEYVDVYENWQLINYALLILTHLKAVAPHDEHVMVNLHVVQPRCYSARGKHRTWSLKASDLRAYANIMRTAAERAFAPNPPAATGDACKHCSGRHACGTFQKVAGAAVDMSSVSVPLELTPEAVSAELRMLWVAQGRMKARITGLEEQAKRILQSGTHMTQLHLVQAEGRETWTVPVDQVIALGQMAGVDVSKPEVITPAQARKNGLNPDMIAAIVERPKAGFKLELDDGTAARNAFKA